MKGPVSIRWHLTLKCLLWYCSISLLMFGFFTVIPMFLSKVRTGGLSRPMYATVCPLISSRCSYLSIFPSCSFDKPDILLHCVLYYIKMSRNAVLHWKTYPSSDCASDHLPVVCYVSINRRKLKKIKATPQLQLLKEPICKEMCKTNIVWTKIQIKRGTCREKY